MRAHTVALLAATLACSCGVAVADESTSSVVTRGENVARDTQTGEPRTRHLSTGSTLGELLRHPAFAGYARRLLPRDDVAIDETLPIGAFASCCRITVMSCPTSSSAR